MYKEYTRPLEQQIDTDKNIFSVLDERANRTPNDSLVEYKNEHGEWSSFSATEFRAKVIAIAKGLIAQGIMPGESVSIISHTCWQWTALDVAIMSIGALTVPVYETNSPAQVKMIFNDANVKMAFAEDDAQRDKIESIRNECSNLGDVYVIGLGAIDTMIEYGHAVSDAEFQEREHAVKGSDLATIVYTSGSTGTPKGIELTHSNFVFITYSGISSMPDIAMKPNRRLLLFLPLAHVFARYMQFFCFAGNVSLGLSSNLKTILADFKAFKPTFILAVPRIFEKIYNAAWSASRSTPRWPGSHCCFGASYLPTTCAPFSGHRIRTAQEPDAVAAFVFAYVGSADHRQHTSSMTHARAHTTMVWRNCWRMRFFSSCAILFRRIRLRYSRSSMMAPSRCCVCAVALCCGKSPA